MNQENKPEKELYEFPEEDIKRAYRPIEQLVVFFDNQYLYGHRNNSRKLFNGF
ncbi:hypothetical protein EHE19_014605 [Ruminiclostridium herbifermentans]|uniref:Uncharacterized protein n=1 Tax=Ruminiclostridium herbifermentans TaxID=2488810 RepID=A0A7H1VL39_9FIRM|nr:hypothetical protein [Ruminiclostridium herbifermentans]QNU66101.1 hypothetical protein EHE19_014605 [Ruminiclostridium herbifermentans]